MSGRRDTVPPDGEQYTQRDNVAFDTAMTDRIATREAAFLLPHLGSTMRLLDVGCGPGTITIGLAEWVAEVVGVDVRPEAVSAARVRRDEAPCTNVRFVLGSVYELPFADHTFDAAFAHVVLMHLVHPIAALREVSRVLRPGGMVAVRDPDLGSVVTFPVSAVAQEWSELRYRVQRHNGGDPSRGRRLRRLLLDAGFDNVEAGASTLTAGTLDETRRHGAFLKAQLLGVARTALAEGWTDQATVDAVTADIDTWAERPDAFSATIMCHAIGWTRHP